MDIGCSVTSPELTMSMLILGVILWSMVHLSPSLAPGVKAGLIAKADTVVYKGLFGLLIVASIVLMTLGWQATLPSLVFAPPAWGRGLNSLLTLLAALLLLGPYIRSNVSRFIRHPQLLAVVMWGIGHVLASGQLRALILFGGLAVWAALEIPLISRREGAWKKPPPVPAIADFRLLIAGVMIFAIMVFTHGWLFGISVVPRW
jgi:uncharacterized membrane protein